MIPFRVTIPSRDYKLWFADEMEGIFAWAVQGAMHWYRDGKAQQGFAVPAVVTNATTAYQDDMDPLSEFMEDCLQDDPEGFVTTFDLFKRYQEWCKRENHKEFFDHRTLTNGFKTRKNFTYGRKRIDGAQQRGFLGMSLAPDTDQDKFLRAFGGYLDNPTQW